MSLKNMNSSIDLYMKWKDEAVTVMSDSKKVNQADEKALPAPNVQGPAKSKL